MLLSGGLRMRKHWLINQKENALYQHFRSIFSSILWDNSMLEGRTTTENFKITFHFNIFRTTLVSDWNVKIIP